MPLVDSFLVDHVKMNGGTVRIGKELHTPKGDIIRVFDIRFLKPNHGKMKIEAIHTLEHLFAGSMREHLMKHENVTVIDLSPMGCCTGFYMSVLGDLQSESVIEAWKSSMEDVLKLEHESEIPAKNIYQCGNHLLHDLTGAQDIARHILSLDIKVHTNEELKLSQEQLDSLLAAL